MRLAYPAVAAVCALLHNIVIIGFDRAGLHYAIASLVSFVLVAAVGYRLHCALTFRTPPGWRGFLRYCAAMAFNLPLSIAALFLFHDLAGLPMIVASPVATVAMIAVNYLLSAWAILGGRPDAGSADRS